jgi:hypothetical protein
MQGALGCDTFDDLAAHLPAMGQPVLPGALGRRIHPPHRVERPCQGPELGIILGLQRHHGVGGGNFDLVEVWIENILMVEVLPPDFAARYLDFAGRMGRAESALAMMASYERSVGA